MKKTLLLAIIALGLAHADTAATYWVGATIECSRMNAQSIVIKTIKVASQSANKNPDQKTKEEPIYSADDVVDSYKKLGAPRYKDGFPYDKYSVKCIDDPDGTTSLFSRSKTQICKVTMFNCDGE